MHTMQRFNTELLRTLEELHESLKETPNTSSNTINSAYETDRTEYHSAPGSHNDRLVMYEYV